MTCTNCQCPFFSLSMDADASSAVELNCLVTDAVKQIQFRVGETLFAQGQSSTSLYSLSRGLVKIISITSDGREQIVGLSQPGKLLLGLQSIDQEHYGYTAIAATDGSACKIRHRALLRALENKTEIALRLIAALNAQLAQSRSLMQAMGQRNASAKIASFILLVAPAENRQHKKINGNGRFPLPFSRNEIAGLLGLREETVCRQMADMKRQGVIYAPRGALEVHDWDRLRGIANA